MKKLILTILALCAIGATIGTVDASAWRSNDFRSPSGNIRCHYDSYQKAITCATVSPRRSVTLHSDSSTAKGRVLPPQRGPVLQYGDLWQTSGARLTCESYETGIDCYTKFGGGFHIERAYVSRW